MGLEIDRVRQLKQLQEEDARLKRLVAELTQEPRTALRLRIREIAQARIRYGYRKISRRRLDAAL